jgi:hypothetical protein
VIHNLAMLADICDDNADDPALIRLRRRFAPIPWWRREGRTLVGRLGDRGVEIVELIRDVGRSRAARSLLLPPDVKEAAVHVLVRLLRSELGCRCNYGII